MIHFHYLHSSVISLPDGNLLEARRGPLTYFDIPHPRVWSSLQAWMTDAPFLRNYIAEFPQPSHWNHEQYWLSQWFHESTLWYNEETATWEKGDAVVFVKNAMDYMIPVYMCLSTGTIQIKDGLYTSFTDAGVQPVELWRMEMGELYRVY